MEKKKDLQSYLSSTWDESLLLKWEEFFVLKDYLKKKWNVEDLVQTHACLHFPPSFLGVRVSPTWWVSGPCAPGILQTLSLKACSFLKRKWKGDVVGESRGVGVAGKNRERGNCGCDILYERIYFKLTKSNEMQYMERTWISWPKVNP